MLTLRVIQALMPAARIVVLGAGFGGLELATILSDALGEDLDLTLIDADDAFVFGYSKLDVMFGRTGARRGAAAVQRDRRSRACASCRRRVTAIDPEREARRPPAAAPTRPTSSSSRSAPTTTSTPRPGSREANEFYSVAGAARLAEVLPEFTSGRAVVGVCGAPFKCPPAPERVRAAAARLPDGARRPRRLRDRARHAVRHAGPAVARHLRRAARGLRGARDRVRAGGAGQLASRHA